ncbi:MAG: gamma-glutamyltransferase [Deltaproteobacteria bacterium]|nr:gamma-glutamyltransferase [Deltaproteobacteria bacterium]
MRFLLRLATVVGLCAGAWVVHATEPDAPACGPGDTAPAPAASQPEPASHAPSPSSTAVSAGAPSASAPAPVASSRGTASTGASSRPSIRTATPAAEPGRKAQDRARRGLPAYPKVVESVGEGGAVATGHPLATRAALRVMRDGGSAVDAAIAAALTLGVVEPYHAGLGGGGFAVVFDAMSASAQSVDFRERAPLATSTSPSVGLRTRRGCSAVAIPGTVAGLWALHQAGGVLPWADLFPEAVAAADQGVVLGGLAAARVRERAPALREDPDAAAIYLPGGHPLRQGDLLLQTDLAETMRVLARDGPQAFYAGPIGQRIVEGCQDRGGLMSLEDFELYRARVGPAQAAQFGDRVFYTVGPPSIGGLQVLQLFRMAQHLPLSAPYGRPQNMHLLAEAMRISFSERTQWASDGERAIVPVELFVDDNPASLAVARIRPARRIPLQHLRPDAEGPVDGGTTHISVVDALGNAVALTMTINFRFGAAVVGRGTGILLNDTMDDFSAPPGESNIYYLSDGPLNYPAPGAPPLSSMSPIIVARGGLPELVLGGVGGPMIPTSVAQVLVNRFLYGMPLRPAVGVPRIHHQLLPDRVAYEGRHLEEDARGYLEQRGHSLHSVRNIGTIYAVEVAPDGTRTAVADVRSHGAAGVTGRVLPPVAP